MTNDGQMDAAETGLDSEYKGTSTFTDGSIGEWPQKSLKAWRKLISLQGKPSDDIYKSPLRHFLTIGDILWSQIEKRHRRRRLRAAATTVADAHWCSDIVGVRAYCKYLLRMIFLDTQCSLTPPAAAAAAAAALHVLCFWSERFSMRSISFLLLCFMAAPSSF